MTAITMTAGLRSCILVIFVAALLGQVAVQAKKNQTSSRSSAYFRYQNFEDYLSTLGRGVRELITSTEDDQIDGSGDEFESADSETTVSPALSALPKYSFKHVLEMKMTKDDTCCMLGQLAGDKGYHCFVKFYAARILMRNQNRVHNRKMAFYGREKVPNYGDKLMRTFEKCIAGRGNIFHKCCYLADMERKAKIHYSSIQRMKRKKQLEAEKKRTILMDEELP